MCTLLYRHLCVWDYTIAIHLCVSSSSRDMHVSSSSHDMHVLLYYSGTSRHWCVRYYIDIYVYERGKRVFITNVKGTFFGMSESEEASKRRWNSYRSAIRLRRENLKKNPFKRDAQKHRYVQKIPEKTASEGSVRVLRTRYLRPTRL